MKIIRLLSILDFKIPKKNKYIFLSEMSFVRLKKIDIFKKFGVISLLSEKINIFVIIITIYKNGFSGLKKNYIKNYVNFVNPSMIVCYIDNYYPFYELYNFFKKKKIISISIQNGMRAIVNDIFSLFDKNIRDLGCDYLLTMNKSTGEKFLEYITAKNIIIGSITNNNNINNNLNKKKTILFISQFTENRMQNGIYDQRSKKIYSGESFYKAEKIVVKFLVNFCKRNNFKFEIASNSSGNSEKEYNFFSSMISNDIEFKLLKKIHENSTYKYSDEAEYTAFIDSTAGYESFARRNKIVGFSIRGNFLDIAEGCSFAWPGKNISEGPCWTSRNDVNEFRRIENFMLNSDNNDWNKIFDEYSEKIMIHDINNSILNNFFKKII
ncbi:LA_1612 family putative O-antigen biosynthesis protein [Candidatus Pelagibacter sp. Uisw_127]|uniref:LA_1612 family putative O-antigen biosynthesis protein n=1 Tax=Candidatus Pelagibacter sp. Uisw_127 TaxID=3230988 RepID=UPI0039EB4134